MYIAYSYGDTALTDTDQEQGAPASGQHGKPRHCNHKYHTTDVLQVYEKSRCNKA
jgi:hypothetical protein